MKLKRVLLGIIVILLISTISLFRTTQKLSDDKSNLIAMHSSVNRENEVLSDKVKALELNIDEYEEVINRWLKFNFDFEHLKAILIKSSNVKAVVYDGNQQYLLPRNGIIEAASDNVVIEITVEKPPVVLDSKINESIHQYDDIYNNITYDTTDESITFTQENETIRFTFNDLKTNQSKQVFTRGRLRDLLQLDESHIKVTRVDSFTNSSKYLPLNIIEKEYTNTAMDNKIIHQLSRWDGEHYFLSVGYYDLFYRYIYDDLENVKYEMINGNMVFAKSIDGVNFVTVDRMILPEVIRLGAVWRFGDLEAMITAIHYPIKTSLGELDTIQVTYRDDEGNIYFQNHFAETYGSVYRKYNSSEDILVSVKYRD